MSCRRRSSSVGRWRRRRTADTATPSPSYFVGEVENNQVTITYTVYNEQADPETGVLLTDTLAPGVTLASASQPPDQSGQNLAWSLGTIQGYDRASVSMTVNLPSPSTLQLDTGAAAHAMLDAAAVSATTPAATLQPGNVSDPSLLASTPDADTTDPFIQEAGGGTELRPDADLRLPAHADRLQLVPRLGPRRAGDALVERRQCARRRQPGRGADARLGHPGAVRLGDALAGPGAAADPARCSRPAYQTVGYIPAGTTPSDPANDPQLLAETESHDWFQFDAGSGMQDADPLMPGATIGQTFTTATGTFTEVPDNLEEKTEVQLECRDLQRGRRALRARLAPAYDRARPDVRRRRARGPAGHGRQFRDVAVRRRADLHGRDKHVFALHRARRRAQPRPEPGRGDPRPAVPGSDHQLPARQPAPHGPVPECHAQRPAGRTVTYEKTLVGPDRLRRAAGRRQHRAAVGQSDRAADPHQQ